MSPGTQGELVHGRAILLKLVPYRESDRIVHLFTEPLGKVSALARGARKSSRRFGGALQPFVLADVRLKGRPTAELLELVEAVPLRAFEALAVDPHRLGRAGYMCELVEVLTRERDPNPAVLALLLEGLELLERVQKRSGALLRAFEVNLLSAIGVWPDHLSCAQCQAEVALGAEAALRPELEGLVCASCGGDKISPAARRLLVPGPLAQRCEVELSAADALSVGRRTLIQIRALAPRPLRSVGFLKQLGDPVPGE